jgi:Asp-tRNA(Asn)/Glu-tRNA(Gln) amidotransferase A subunit family amidase
MKGDFNLRHKHAASYINSKNNLILYTFSIFYQYDYTVRGPLHGVPILIKDNIATFDKMNNTAGSFALLGAKVPKDSTLAAKLRAAGAIILGNQTHSYICIHVYIYIKVFVYVLISVLL